MLLDSSAKGRQRVRQVRGEGAVDVGLELGQVDLDGVVVGGALISLQVLPVVDRSRGVGGQKGGREERVLTLQQMTSMVWS